MSFSFQLLATKGHARAGGMHTPHGIVKTPIFMPVGTLGTVKSLDTQDIEKTDAQIILGNTYHLYLRPGMEIIQKMGGLHKFMGWDKPMLTDSGGFQVFSLGLQQVQKTQTPAKHPLLARSASVKHTPSIKISPEGVNFFSHLDGSKHFFSPEKAIQVQREIGADIIMAFDECTPDQADIQYAREALDRTHRWADQCLTYWKKHDKKSVYGKYQALFGIVQGALHKDLRRESAQFMSERNFDGIALGGESIGYNMRASVEIMDWVRDILPEDKPRYAMGLGRDPQNIIDAILAGYDMFDCVAPTRLARNGTLYVGELKYNNLTTKQLNNIEFHSMYKNGRLQIGNTEFKDDQKVIQPGCDCATCQAGYPRAYLRHLFKTQELTYYRLASIHNVRFMVRLSEEMREWIVN